jgi:hypothetical protein
MWLGALKQRSRRPLNVVAVTPTKRVQGGSHAQGKNKESRNPKEEGSGIDPEVLDVMEEQKRTASGRAPRDARAERRKTKLAEDGLKAIKAKDARAFTELLRQAGIQEGSVEWKNAWKAFYSA